MSDKNRNMNDINDQKTAEQQAFSEEIRRRLAEPGSGKPTLEEFKLLVYKDREKRRKKRNALVACIVAAFIVGFLTFDDLVPEVGADKNPKETIQTEDGVIIEDGGYGSSVGEENVYIVDDWTQISEAKKTVSKLPIPQYIPRGYLFKQLRIETAVENDSFCKYLFVNKAQKCLEIETFITKGEVATSIDEEYKTVECMLGKIYIKEGEKTAIIHLEDGVVINIWYEFDEDELIKLVENLDYH